MPEISDTQPGFVWMEFPDHGGKQQFPAESVPLWRARGWQECDPPVPANPLKDPVLDEPEAAPAPAEAEPKKTRTTTRPGAGTDTPQEG